MAVIVKCDEVWTYSRGRLLLEGDALGSTLVTHTRCLTVVEGTDSSIKQLLLASPDVFRMKGRGIHQKRQAITPATYDEETFATYPNASTRQGGYQNIMEAFCTAKSAEFARGFDRILQGSFSVDNNGNGAEDEQSIFGRLSPDQMSPKTHSPFWNCSAVWGTKYLKLEWFVPKTGLPS